MWWYHLKICVASLGNYAPFGTVSIGGEAVPAIGIGYARCTASFPHDAVWGAAIGSHEVVLGVARCRSCIGTLETRAPAEIDGHFAACA